MRRFMLVVAAAVSIPAFAATTTWDIDPAHSSAGFSVRHMMVSNVHGTFNKVTGTVMLDDKDLKNSSVEATIDTTSINTGVEKRDAHLKSPDFFDAAKFPTLTFKSTKIAKAGANKYKVQGDLTMHGVTKPATLDVTATAPVKNVMGKGWRRGVEATTKVKREDFGLTWNAPTEAGGVVVSKEVTVTIDAELVSHADETKATPGTEKAETPAAKGK